jgi:phosphoglycolate phosphatase
MQFDIDISKNSMNNLFPRAVIFDWDNTLIDSWQAIADAMNYTLAHFGRSVWSMADVKMNCVRSARDSFPEWFPGKVDEAIQVFYARFAEVQMQGLSPLPGVAELVQWLHDQKIPTFVVSNKNGHYLREEAKALRWDHLFVKLAGATDAPRDKPAREHVDFALAQSGLSADATVWFVGDSETDMQCARNAGCTPVLIGDADLAARLGVEFVFSDCQALLTMLKDQYPS